MPSFLYSQLFVTPPYPKTSFSGQTIIVTGSNVGLGLEAARHFVRLNAAKVIIAVRNLKAGEEAKRDIERTTNRTDVCEVWELDLASYDSVKAFGRRANDLSQLHAVVENAGIATDKHSIAEKDERTITVNVVSTFLLALLLLPKLRSTAKEIGSPTKLTIVSSEVHGWVSIEKELATGNVFDAIRDPKDMGPQYPRSKLLEVLVIREIAPQLADSGVVLNMLNPGLCHSSLSRDSGWILTILKFLLARSTEVGSRTLVAGTEAGPESHGKYMSDSVVAEDALSSFVRSENGKKAQGQVWKELKVKLEAIRPGITDALK